MESGFIKIYRSLLKWEWYDDPKTLKLFLHLLMTVNITNSRWHGIEIPRGSRVMTFRKLAEELHYTNREIRTHLARLESTHEVTRTSYRDFSVITVVRWSDYQDRRHTKRTQNDTESDKPPTHDRHYYKKIEEDNKKNKEIRACAREDAPSGLSEEQLRELKRKMRE